MMRAAKLDTNVVIMLAVCGGGGGGLPERKRRRGKERVEEYVCKNQTRRKLDDCLLWLW